VSNQTIKIATEEDRSRAIHVLRHIEISAEAPVQLKVSAWKRNRSVDQNRLYWKWLSIMAPDLGYASTADLHDALKLKFCVPLLILSDEDYAAGVIALKSSLARAEDEEALTLRRFVVRLTSTSALSVKQMTQYLEAIEVFASEMGITLTVNDA
jgi:hypothetical protein